MVSSSIPPEERFADLLEEVAQQHRLKAFGFPISLPRAQKPEGIWGQFVDRREVPLYRLGWFMTKEELLDKHDSDELAQMEYPDISNMRSGGYFRRIWNSRVPENRIAYPKLERYGFSTRLDAVVVFFSVTDNYCSISTNCSRFLDFCQRSFPDCRVVHQNRSPIFLSVTRDELLVEMVQYDRSRMDRADNEALISSMKAMLDVQEEPRWYCY